MFNTNYFDIYIVLTFFNSYFKVITNLTFIVNEKFNVKIPLFFSHNDYIKKTQIIKLTKQDNKKS